MQRPYPGKDQAVSNCPKIARPDRFPHDQGGSHRRVQILRG